ncbi:MAG: hypothetical protein OWU32_07520 [Firmicutes bacterium]|nr:hypothetical protein [Bacillota bacterium]
MQRSGLLSVLAMRRWLAAIWILLWVQFALGMVVNLWTVIPTDVAQPRAVGLGTALLRAAAWAGHHSPWPLRLHAICGVLLGIVTLLALRAAWRTRIATLIVLSWLGFLCVCAASFCGLLFILSASNVDSLIMSLVFALGLVSISLAWGAAGRVPRPRLADETLGLEVR